MEYEPGMLNLEADSRVHQRNQSETIKLTRGRFSNARLKAGCMGLVPLANEWNRDIEGSFSVLSMPAGMSSATF